MKNIKTDAILWFLKSKGWTIADENISYHILAPPAGNKDFDEKARLYIPLEKFEGTASYIRNIKDVLETISFIYEVEVPDLIVMFSTPLSKLKKDIQHLQGMISAASS
jgi:hypothetical protein